MKIKTRGLLLALGSAALLTTSPLAGKALAWGTDVLVKDEVGQTDVSPSMVSTSTQGYFLVRDNAENDCMDILRSTDGGRHWTQFFGYCGGAGNEVSWPSIAVPQEAQDYVYVAFNSGSAGQIRLLRIDLSNPLLWTVRTIEYDRLASGAEGPRIVTDNADNPDYRVFVSFTVRSGGQDCLNTIRTLTSTDKGVTWSGDHTHGCFTAQWGPDLAYGNGMLYVTWLEGANGDVPIADLRVERMMLSEGGVWSGSTNLSTGAYPINSRPRIAAAPGSGAVMVVFSSYIGFDAASDIFYAYSSDRGGTWTKDVRLPGSTNWWDERPEVVVDSQGGFFHVIFLPSYVLSGQLRYTRAPCNGPDAAWTAPVRVDGGIDWTLADTFPTSTIAVDSVSGTPGVAWASGTRGIYFDREDFGPNLTIPSVDVSNLVPRPGQTIAVTATVKNAGTDDAGPFRLDIYNHLPGGVSPNPPGDVESSFCAWSGLAVGATATCTKFISYPATDVYRLWAYVDANRTVLEADESENAFGPLGVYVGFPVDGPETHVVRFTSRGPQDGVLQESAEASSLGGTAAASGDLLVGDDLRDRQLRALLSFDTASLPDNAVIVSAILGLKGRRVVGRNPYQTHGQLVADLRAGALGRSAVLEPGDFQARASFPAAAQVLKTEDPGWHRGLLVQRALRFISKTGLTQVRVRFSRDDDDDRKADFIGFHSGDATTGANRPELIVEYVVNP